LFEAEKWVTLSLAKKGLATIRFIQATAADPFFIARGIVAGILRLTAELMRHQQQENSSG